MQDRYAGDIGDFAKFAVLRGLVGDSGLRLGLVWYLTSQRGDPAGDGRHTQYLDRNTRNEAVYRSCDPELYDCLADIVNGGKRSVAAFPTTTILPPDTVYFDAPLEFDLAASRSERAAIRTQWVRAAANETASCDVVMFDPDNGLEVRSAAKYTARGPKYVFFDELARYVARGQTVIVYQHANRSRRMIEQVSARLRELRQRLPLTAEPFGLVWRSVSSRAFLVAPAIKHENVIIERTKLLISGLLGRHLDRYP